ncbi:cbb3-type cytochrome oxidase assembly protein CcoS [Thalassolituus sp.]|uniref:cbb3-type cytochrome oxidase assembly protein CcoS n=1 Tax=Thalassolituus sp. TaxID=2030822 RepID=UPI002A7EC222|nr:cbb3-type cytochrome oxidase assembly protein CcoS [Thalassolituus sp.]
MDIIYILVPLSIALIGIAVVVFFWAVKGGQFDDLESPAHKILFDDDEHLIQRKDKQDESKPDRSEGPKKQ